MTLNTYEQNRRKSAAEFETILSAVAGYLPGWRAVIDEYNWSSLKHTSGDGRSITASRDHNGRLHFSCSWPRAKTSNYVFSPKDGQWSISVSGSREPSKIAADLKRRLIDKYEGEYVQRTADRDEYDSKSLKQRSILQSLAAIVGHQVKDSSATSVYCHSNTGVRKIDVYSDGTVAIETDHSLSAETAAKVLRLLMEESKT